jgi:hypothetical protein
MIYIMRGYHYDKAKVTIEDIIAEERRDFSIVVGQREVGYNKFVPVFVVSSGDCVPAAPYRTEYTQDTGLGYKNKGKEFIIENVIYVNKDGVIAKKVNSVGMTPTEKRSPWVFK